MYVRILMKLILIVIVTKISVGAEYIPNLIGRSYFAHIKYRLGAYYTTPYYKIDGKKASREYGVTAGFGLPVPRSRSILSISGQFVRVKRIGDEHGE